jgi:hypothetical protein
MRYSRSTTRPEISQPSQSPNWSFTLGNYDVGWFKELVPLVRYVWIFTPCIRMGLYRRFGGCDASSYTKTTLQLRNEQIILQGLKIHKFYASFRRFLTTLYFHSVPDHVVWTIKEGIIVSGVAACKVFKYLAEQKHISQNCCGKIRCDKIRDLISEISR